MILLAATDWYAFFFLLFALIACVFAAAVLFTSNIVRMAFYLTLSLGATAGLFFLAGSEFIGAMQLMIYVGGTLVLLIFGVMLTAQAPFITMRTRSGEWILAVVAGSALLVLLLAAAFGVADWRQPGPAGRLPVAEAQTATAVGAGLAGVRVDMLNIDDARQRQGLSGYLLPFVIVSVHLLVVLIGAAYLARTKTVYAPVRPAARPTAAKERPWLVSCWLSLLLLGDLSAVIVILFGTQWLQSLAAGLQAAPAWTFAFAWFLALGHAVCVVALFSWRRWGFYGLCVAGLVSGIPAAVALGLPAGIVKVGGQAVLIGILFALMKMGGDRSVWAQLEP